MFIQRVFAPRGGARFLRSQKLDAGSRKVAIRLCYCWKTAVAVAICLITNRRNVRNMSQNEEEFLVKHGMAEIQPRPACPLRSR